MEPQHAHASPMASQLAYLHDQASDATRFRLEYRPDSLQLARAEPFPPDPLPFPSNSLDVLHRLSNSPQNQHYLDLESQVLEIQRHLRALTATDLVDHANLIDMANVVHRCLHIAKGAAWQRNVTTSTRKHEIWVNDNYFEEPRPRTLLARLECYRVLLGRYFFHTSRVYSKIGLVAERMKLRILQRSEDEIPRSASTFVRDLGLDGPLPTVLVVCPSCDALYSPMSHKASFDVQNIPTCTWKQTPASLVCAVPLYSIKSSRTGKPRLTPRLKYASRSVKDWIGLFLSQPGMEDLMESYKQCGQSPEMSDIQQSPFWWTFPGPDAEGVGVAKEGQTFFGDASESELRLLFGFGLDGFNPFRMGTAKQACQNITIMLARMLTDV
ncbi:hypothetical protein CYLTODRAFT_454802 [Cylindrobasidium torrendii FP15055 ss-10]|uniref:Uncharacterized protein n=1 Tax=Cylindrobasidium torrendii FP15055 ss-10 TaxID=1314674 RepID=A0A0D7B9X6_9AGAR|nr:hypothetical protein CYLTODRAFT_454802 [Cylindrobasidium torrendii FP15055 ss-10]